MKQKGHRSGSFRALVRIRGRRYIRAGLRMNRIERLGSGAMACLVLAVLISWRLNALKGLAAVTDPAALPDALRNAAFQTQTILAALGGFVSYAVLWYADDLEILDPLPLDPKDILGLRVVTTLAYTGPFMGLGLAAYLPVLMNGSSMALGMEFISTFLFLWLISAVGGMGWHVLAAASAGSDRLASIKALLAGALVRPERTFLLYAPMAAGAMSIGCTLAFQRGMASLLEDRIGIGILLLAGALGTLGGVFFITRRLFDRLYYEALAAYLEGEETSVLPEAEVNDDYLGHAWVDMLPEAWRPLVRRDLLQAWRRGRLDGIVLIGISWIALAAALVHRLDAISSTAVWAFCATMTALAGGMAFRLARRECDPPEMWLWLPLSFRRQYLSRGLSILYFPLLIIVPLSGVLWRTGTPLLHVLPAMLGSALGSTALALNVSVRFLGRPGIAFSIYAGLLAASILGWRDAIGMTAGSFVVLGMLSFGLLRGYPDTMRSPRSFPV